MSEIEKNSFEITGVKSSIFSKPIIVAIFFFVTGVLISGVLVFWSQKQMLKIAAEEVKQCAEFNKEYEKIKSNLNNWVEYGKEFKYKSIGGCSGEKCLFQGPEAVEGYGYLEGYYSTKNTIDWGEVPVTCDVLITTGGSEELVNDLLEKVKRGNTINSLDEKGNLMVNILFEGLSVNDKNLIKNSTINNKTKLKIVRVTPQGMGAPACGSFIDIVSVQ